MLDNLIPGVPQAKAVIAIVVGVVIAVLLAIVVVDASKLRARKAELAACAARNAQQVADIRAKTAEAQAADIQHAVVVKTAQDSITEKTNASLEAQLADARARAADLSRRVRRNAEVGSGGSGPTSVPAVADTAVSTAGAGETTVVASQDDVACAEGVTKAQGWQDWWSSVVTVER